MLSCMHNPIHLMFIKIIFFVSFTASKITTFTNSIRYYKIITEFSVKNQKKCFSLMYFLMKINIEIANVNGHNYQPIRNSCLTVIYRYTGTLVASEQINVIK